MWELKELLLNLDDTIVKISLDLRPLSREDPSLVTMVGIGMNVRRKTISFPRVIFDE